jgi:hypothetical protein
MKSKVEKSKVIKPQLKQKKEPVLVVNSAVKAGPGVVTKRP